MGYEAEAKKVAIAKQEALRESGDLDWRSSKWNCFAGRPLGHGYRPWCLLGIGAIAIVLGAIFFRYGFDHNVLRFAGEPASQGIQNPWDTPWYFAVMYVFAYSVDVFEPLFRLGLRENWQSETTSLAGQLLLVWSWIETVLGWALSTLFVVAFTSLIRKD